MHVREGMYGTYTYVPVIGQQMMSDLDFNINIVEFWHEE